MIAPDGQEYGPVNIDVLKQWVTESRVTPETKLKIFESGQIIVAGTLQELYPKPQGTMAPGTGQPGMQPPGVGPGGAEPGPARYYGEQSNYYRPAGATGGPQRFIGDKIVGAILAVFSSCGLIFGAIIAVVGGSFASQVFGSQFNGPQFASMGSTIFIIMGILVALISILGIAIGVGVFRTQKWAFIVGTFLYGLNVLCSFPSLANAQGSTVISLVIGIGIFMYCLLRWIGTVGPKWY